MPALVVESVLMTVEEYLAAEERSEVRHEYLAGVPYAMAGASGAHNLIAFNLGSSIQPQLRGKGCRFFGLDVKLALSRDGDNYFYYPDGMIVCGNPRIQAASYENPTVIFEVISESTRRIDEVEKWRAYREIASAAAYVRIEQDRQRVVVERRNSSGWMREILTEPAAVLSLPAIGVEVPLAAIYDQIDFPT